MTEDLGPHTMPHPSPGPTRRRAGLAVLAIALVTAGCSMLSGGSESESAQRAAKERADQLLTLRTVVTAVTSSAADLGRRAALATDNVELKMESVVYRQRIAEDALNALWSDPPLIGLLDVWALVVQCQAFSEQQVKADHLPEENTASLASLRSEVDSEMKRVFGDHYADARKSIERFAAERPIQQGFVRVGVTSELFEKSETKSFFAWVPDVSLNPFSSVGQGLGESAQAIETVSRAVDRFTDVATALPLQLSWQIEMIQYRLSDDPQLTAISSGFHDTAQAANAAVASIDAMPARVREEVVTALDSLDPKLAEVQATLAGVKDAAGALEPMASSFDAAAKSLGGMASQLDTTLKAFDQTYTMLQGDPNAPPPPPDAPKAHPFDIREFEATGQALTAMAAQLQKTLDTFQQVVSDPALAGRIKEASGSATRTVTTIIWTAVGGGLLLAIGVALVLLGYRRTSRHA